VAGPAGLLLAASATTRAVSLALVLATAAVLAVSRIGWRPLVAFVLGVGVVLVPYAVWFHHDNGTYGFSTVEGTFLYGRIAPVIDCDHMTLTPQQRQLCPTQPVGVRPDRGDWYVFHSTAIRDVSDAQLRQFVGTAVGQQPGPVLRLVAGDVTKYFVPSRTAPDWVCARAGLMLPAQPPTGGYAWCEPNPRQSFDIAADPATMPRTTALTRWLGGYGHVVVTPAPLMLLSLVLVVGVAAWRPRRPVVPRTAQVLLLGLWGVGLIVVGMVGAQYDVRYGVPSLALLPPAGALAARRLWVMWQNRLADSGRAADIVSGPASRARRSQRDPRTDRRRPGTRP
jgi:hypothetical protein